jgi:NitT/TauT family transport system ATP-binding protein
MLPHARPGGISGMLEILTDRGGHDDIYHLADDLSFEIDDVLPIVEAASMLGFVNVSEGDVELSTAGRQYVEADIAERKELFGKSALERVTLIRQIKRALESKSNHTLPDEFFHDTLDEHFSEEETVQQLQTAINWGRYAGLFDYDSASRKFYISDEETETVSA